MKYKNWEILSCDCKDEHKYIVIWSWFENWYSYYNLRNIEKETVETLLIDFVDQKFKKIEMSFIKKMLIILFC